MSQFWTILRFELSAYLKNKVFVSVTVLLVAVLAVVLFIPRLTAGGSDSGDDAPPEAGEDRPVMLLAAEDGGTAEDALEAFQAAFPDYDVRPAGPNEIEEQIVSGAAECAFTLTGPDSYTYWVENLSLYDTNTDTADEAMLQQCRMAALTGAGLAPDEAARVLNTQITHETRSLGVDQGQNFFYTYIMIFALYIVILLYGQLVASGVAAEKSSRAMEVLVTAAKPTAMMFGKVLAACLAGLGQLVCVFGSALLFFRLNRAYWADGIGALVFDMPVDLLGYLLLFFLLGFFLYAFLFGAVGSMVSKMEELNTASMPVIMLFIVAFFVVEFSMTDGSVDSPLMVVCSYVPFTAPMAMFTRIAMSAVPWYEIAASVAVLLASVVGVGVLSAKIYRVGVLLYGSRPSLRALLRSARGA